MSNQFEQGLSLIYSSQRGPSEREFIRLAYHLKRLAGINLPLSDKNQALISSRLHKLRALGLHSFDDLIRALDSNDRKASNLFVSAMTTNTTHFFREPQHFEVLIKLAQERLNQRTAHNVDELRIWCAASSTGEEPYGIAMTLDQMKSVFGFRFRILATDIDHVVLKKAREGVYTSKQVEAVPLELKHKCFVKHKSRDGPIFVVRDHIKEHVQFGRFNLMKNYPFKGKFDIIFCRNVLIYFDRETVSYVISKLTSVMQPGGFLFLGHSEAIAGMTGSLVRVGPAVYRKV